MNFVEANLSANSGKSGGELAQNNRGQGEPAVPALPPTAEQIGQSLAAARTAEECMALAGLAETGIADPQVASEMIQRCLNLAISLDRNCQAALLASAVRALDQGDLISTFVLLEETRRAGLLPAEVTTLHGELAARTKGNGQLEDYFRAIGRVTAKQPGKSLSVLLVTNLFPPQELGGYGRMMWEFAHGLITRGHRVTVLTSDLSEFGKSPTADEIEMEKRVERSLRLHGTWVGGRAAPITDRAEIVRRMSENAARLRAVIENVRPDFVLAGNLDFFGASILQPAFRGHVPVLHALANASPGFSVGDQPRDPLYWVAPCSDWNGQVFAQAGFTPARMETVYPGARIDRFFRFFLPDTRRLRVCYASLVLPYKGADTLVDALGRLHRAGVDFSAEIAGDAPDATFLADLNERVVHHGMQDKVRFTGFLDRSGLAALFARNNVLVFPSIFNEPFGISQVEALAAGLVVVSSGTGGAREIVRDGTDGLLFRAGDAADLAAKLSRLAQEAALMGELQARGQARATQFSVERSVIRIEQLAAGLQDAILAAGVGDLASLMQG